ncbi:hypothetical protein GZH53_15165 [Flavihumibacter sp. R14]|nr:hypothetical protein [Flavihumibacter soli]
MNVKLLSIIIWISVSLLMPTEKYYVTFVKGKVINQKTQKMIKVGDALSPEDKLVFDDRTAKVSFISPGKGRFDINSTSAKANAQNELFAILKSSLVPASNTYHLSTRSLVFEGYDPATYFSSMPTKDRVLLIRSEVLPIKPSYRLDGSNFFFLQFTSEGKTITRKVDHTANGLMFSDRLFQTGSGAIVDKVSLCYQSNASGTARSTVVASFHPVLANKEDVSAEVNLLKTMLDNSDKGKLKAELTNHIFDNYGKIGAEELSRLFGI